MSLLEIRKLIELKARESVTPDPIGMAEFSETLMIHSKNVIVKRVDHVG